MGKRNPGRFFALAAGICFGVWFGAVLAAGREDQARTINEDPNAACSIRVISHPGEVAGLSGASQAVQGCGKA